MSIERRYAKGDVEVRQGRQGPMLVGYAAVFNRDSQDLGGFIEQVDPGAFAKTLREADVKALGNHDPDWLLGRIKNGTLRLATDETGLRYEVDINTQDPDGQRALAKVQRGDWDGSSFCFETIRDEWDWGSEPAERRLIEVRLVDVGPVTFPAYPDASVAARALQPVADRLGHPVENILEAVRSGQMRSLLGARAPTAEQRQAVGSTDLPLSERDAAWDAAAARKSLRPADFAAAHFWRIPGKPADQISSYKLPFAKRTGDGLVAVWRGVTAAAQRLSQTEGLDEQAVRAKIGAYYRAAAREYADDSIKPPWEQNSLSALAEARDRVQWLREHRDALGDWEQTVDLDQVVAMISLGCDFLDDEEDEDGLAAMREILNRLISLLLEEIDEEPDGTPGQAGMSVDTARALVLARGRTLEALQLATERFLR